MITPSPVIPRVFSAIQNVNTKELAMCSEKEVRPILPCLVRMSLISPLDITKECVEARKEILTILSAIESVNSIVGLLSIDFHGLEIDVRKEQQLRYDFVNSRIETNDYYRYCLKVLYLFKFEKVNLKYQIILFFA